MTDWVSIRTGKEFSGREPDSVEISDYDPGTGTISIPRTVKRGEKGWDGALERWMLEHGYVVRSVYDREPITSW